MSGLATVVVAAVVPPFLVAALAPQISRDFAFGTRELGLALAVSYGATSAFSPLGGRLVQRWGPGPSLRVSTGVTTAALVVTATATNPTHLVAALAVAGISNTLTQPASNMVLSTIRTPRARALGFGLVQASIPAAALVAGGLLAAGTYVLDWRNLILVVAAGTVLAQFALPPLPLQARPSTLKVVGPEARPASGRWFMATLLVGGCLAAGSATALPSFTATTGVTAGVAPWLVATAQAAGSAGSVVVRVVAPWVTAGAPLGRSLRAIALLLALGVAGMLALATGTVVGFLIGIVTAFAFGWGWNGLYNLVVATARPAEVATATGLTQAGVFLGGTIGPLAFAAVAAVSGHSGAWLAMAAMMAVGALACVAASSSLERR